MICKSIIDPYGKSFDHSLTIFKNQPHFVPGIYRIHRTICFIREVESGTQLLDPEQGGSMVRVEAS